MAIVQDSDTKSKAVKRGAIRMHLSAVLVALAAAALIIAGFPTWNQHRKELVDVSTWFEVFDLTVPDHQLGSNPVISFDRVIHIPLRGEWVAEVQSVSDNGFLFMCGGHGANIYEPSDLLPDPVTWDWFVWDKGTCENLPEGNYRLEVRWDFCKSSWPCKTLTRHSNVFKIE